MREVHRGRGGRHTACCCDWVKDPRGRRALCIDKFRYTEDVGTGSGYRYHLRAVMVMCEPLFGKCESHMNDSYMATAHPVLC